MIIAKIKMMSNYIPVIILKMYSTTEVSHLSPPIKIRKISKKIPYCLKKFLKASNFSGMNFKSIQWPSKGGIGIRLNKAKIMFICTIKENIITNPGAATSMLSGENLKISPKNRATKRFDRGPTAATLIDPHFWSLRL